MKSRAEEIAEKIWSKANASERHGFKFGLFPAWVAKEMAVDNQALWFAIHAAIVKIARERRS